MKYKLLSLAAILLLLTLALAYISGIVQDRQTYRQIAVESVARSLAGPQTLTGPLIHMACTEEWDYRDEKQLRTGRREFVLSAAPSTLTVTGRSDIQERSRGLHATQVFSLKARLLADWSDLRALKPVAEHPGARLSCGQPLLMLAVSDARGIRGATMKIAGQPASLTLKPGTFFGAYPRGVHAPLTALARQFTGQHRAAGGGRGQTGLRQRQ